MRYGIVPNFKQSRAGGTEGFLVFLLSTRQSNHNQAIASARFEANALLRRAKEASDSTTMPLCPTSSTFIILHYDISHYGRTFVNGWMNGSMN